METEYVKYYNVHMKKCIDNYRKNHREEINAKRRENYKKRMEEDPTFREKIHENTRKQNERLKLRRQQNKQTES